MKNTKYIILLALCLSLGFAGCGETKNNDSETAGTNSSSDASESAGGSSTDSGTTSSKGSTRLVSVSDVSKYITIGQYKGLELTRTVSDVPDADVEYEVNAEMKDKAEEVSDSIANGDLVTIDFTGTIDGETFNGSTGTNYDLIVGEGTMIDGFEDALIGMTKGETKTIDLTIPAEYSVEEGGKTAQYQITVQKIRRVPELTDAWVQANIGLDSVDAYKSSVRETLEAQAKETAESNLRSDAWNTVVASSEVKEYPEEDLENAKDEYIKEVEEMASEADMELEDFLTSQNYTQELLDSDSQEYAKYIVKQNLIVQGIMDKEGLTFDDEESIAIQNELIADYQKADLAALIDEYGQQAIDESIGLLRVEKFIVENATVTDQVSLGADGTTAVVMEDPESENAEVSE